MEIVRQTVQIGQRADHAGRQRTPLGTPANGTAHMSLRRSGTTAGQHETGKGIAMRRKAVDFSLQHTDVGIVGTPGAGTYVHQPPLHVVQPDSHIGRNGRSQQSHVTVQFVHRPAGLDRRTVFRNPPPVGQRGSPAVTAARI